MTHPPYGDDDRNRGTAGGGPDARDEVHPASPTPVPPPHAGWGQQDQGQPSAWPPPHQPYGRPAAPAGEPTFGPPHPQYARPGQYGQPQYGPQYGQPQYGPYGSGTWGQPPQPPRRSRRPRLLLSLAALLLLIVWLVALPFLSGRTALDPDAVQRDVAGQFELRNGVAVDLRCADEMTVDPGRTYSCSGITADGEPVTITIAITDADANYTWSEG